MSELHPLQQELQNALDAGDFNRAIHVVQTILTDPEADRPTAHVLLGKLRLLTSDEDAARAHFERVLALPDAETRSPNAWCEAAEQLAWLMRHQAPTRALALMRARTQHPEPSAWALHLYAQLLFEEAQAPQAACDTLRQALHLSDLEAAEHYSLTLQLALWTDDDQEHAACVQALGLPAIKAQGDLPNLIARSLDRHPLYLQWLQDALSLYASDLAVSLQVAAHRTLRQLSSAFELARAHAHTADEEGQECLRLSLELAILTHELEVAQQLLSQTEAHALPISAEVYGGLAEALLRHKHAQAAFSVVERGLVAFSHSAGLWLQRSQALLGLGQAEEAEASLERASLLQPDIARQTGQFHQNLRQYRQALTHCQWPHLAEHWGQGQLAHTWHGHNAHVTKLTFESAPSVYIKGFFPKRRTSTEVEESARVMNAFAQALAPSGLQVSQALETESGTYACSMGQGVGFAMTEVPGAPLAHWVPQPRAHMSPLHARSLGLTAALVTKASASLTLSDAEHPHQESSWTLTRLVREGAEGFLLRATRMGLSQQANTAVAHIAQHLAQLTPELQANLERYQIQWVHGDFSWHNTLWSESGDILSLIDFDYLQRDVSFSDVLNAALRSAWNWRELTHSGDPHFRPELLQALLDAYETSGEALPSRRELVKWAQLSRLRYYLQLADMRLLSEQGPLQNYGSPELILMGALDQMAWLARHPHCFEG